MLFPARYHKRFCERVDGHARFFHLAFMNCGYLRNLFVAYLSAPTDETVNE
jgi:hypothetical protein